MNSNEPHEGSEPGPSAEGPEHQPVDPTPEAHPPSGDDPSAEGTGQQPSGAQPAEPGPWHDDLPGGNRPLGPPSWVTDPGRAPTPDSGWGFSTGHHSTGHHAQQSGHTQPPGGPQPPYGNTGAFQAPGMAGPPHGAYAHPQYGHPPPQPERKRGNVVAIALITALITSLIVGPAAALGSAYLFPDGLGSPSSSLSGEQGNTPTEGEAGEVADKVLPSVVSIQTPQGGGSGVILSSDGQILTNSHVVTAAEGEPLEVLFNDGTAARADILGADPVSDIAVIQAKETGGLTPAELGDSDQVGVGGDVIAIGSPLGLSGTVTTGVVSALNRPVNTGMTESGEAQTSTVINAIQTDAAINPGNSGGPLVNMSGEVIGINTAIAGVSQESGSVGLGFAIPINQARPIAEQLIEEGSASYPAIEATIAGDPAGGARVVEVTDGGAADDAGLEAGDVVVSVDGNSVNTPDQLIAEIRAHHPGEELTLGVLRGGEEPEEEVSVTLGEQSADDAESEGD